MQDRGYVDQLIDTLTQRLEVLELQSAGMGINTPPHIVTEIQDIKEKIETTRLSSHSIISAGLIERMTPIEQWKTLYDSVWEIEVMLYALQKNIANDRINIQSRHKEFNIAIQKLEFKYEILLNNVHRNAVLQYSTIIISIVMFIVLFIR